MQYFYFVPLGILFINIIIRCATEFPLFFLCKLWKNGYE